MGVTIAGGLALAARLALLSLCGRKRPNFRVRSASLGFSTCVCPIGLVLLRGLRSGHDAPGISDKTGVPRRKQQEQRKLGKIQTTNEQKAH